MSDQRERILQSAKTRYATVDCGEWGQIRIRSVSDYEYQQARLSIVDDDGKIDNEKRQKLNAAFIHLAVVEDDGSQTFVNGELEQIVHMDAGFSTKLMRGIENHWGVTEEEEELEKNSVATGDDSSPTD